MIDPTKPIIPLIITNNINENIQNGNDIGFFDLNKNKIPKTKKDNFFSNSKSPSFVSVALKKNITYKTKNKTHNILIFH
jgi:hypothetical protein